MQAQPPTASELLGMDGEDGSDVMPSGSARSMLADARALRTTAPLRAAYELSKAGGGHAVAFGALAAGPRRRTLRFLPLATAAEVPQAARARTLAEAEQILAGRVTIFGRAIDTGTAPVWHVSPDTSAIWSQSSWWKVDIRTGQRAADVKWTWELGRHRHLLVVARAAALTPQDPVPMRYVEAQIAGWLQQNPPEKGVHWYSNLEIALRALVWLQLLALVGSRLDPALHRRLVGHLQHSGRHLVVDLPYTVSSMRNNHMLGDALGLIALGIGFDRPSWCVIGDRLFNGQLARHMRADGSMIEDSLSYHRFVTEMLAVRVLLGSAPEAAFTALRTSGEHLARVGAFAGPVPQYGDWDEGRVLTSSGDPLDITGSAALALSLTGSGASAEWRDAYDECAWYAAEGEPAPVPAAPTSGRTTGGGFARGEAGAWTAWLKAGGGTSHQHADLGSTVFRVGPQWVVGDPGTGTYNGPLEQRNAFRTSGAHSVLRLDQEDQLLPHRAFRWLRKADGVVGPAPQVPGAVVLWGAHDAYLRAGSGGRVARLVVMTPGALTVCDVVENAKGRRWDLTLPLHPEVISEGCSLRLPSGAQLELDLPAEPVRAHGQEEPYAGWWSDTYGSAVPATWLQMTGVVDDAVVWAVHEPGRAPAGRLPDGLELDGRALRIAFTPEAVTMTMSGRGGPAEVLWVRLPG